MKMLRNQKGGEEEEEEEDKRGGNCCNVGTYQANVRQRSSHAHKTWKT
jgi:hypothetical protein